ncbi:uncharacterized protein LOC106136327 isoform X2 [Amyelois transitella]|nr:uncharacterized protein LOC106136327 isoform X2 [Amyelois transitella]XP_060804237.1 uncharacterized protein LOC106136327 isoform X2 [Amyelois transitella]XP_060804238.1 uncharacterized protein LOC106136327 isoform X2 [Amyelois transitella]
MCHEGGCGACIVSVLQTHPLTKEKRVFSVNSCLVHVLSCHQWDITTIEGVGNRKDGYHAVQSRLAAFNGTQCGYCTPGWVMSMYSLYSNANRLSMQQLENSFGSNMCRCTGYRPILDAFKSFAKDVGSDLKKKIQDVEDLDKLKCNKKCERRCSVSDEWCLIDSSEGSLMEVGGYTSRWYKAFTIKDVFQVLSKEGIDSYRLISGNTGQGVFPLLREPRIFIDISSISSLKDSFSEGNLVLGAAMTLTDVMNLFLKWSSESEDFLYLKEFYDHLDLVAHVPVRNIGTIGGNLAMKNLHPDFPSDVFLILETVNAAITLVDNTLVEHDMDLKEFLKVEIRNKLIKQVKIPPLSLKTLIRTYKIMSRSQNVHAIVNAGFRFKVDDSNKVIEATIVYGNIRSSFIRAKETEDALKSQELFSEETLQRALKALNDELAPEDIPPDPSPFCRKTLALGLFYKAILSYSPRINPRFKSGASKLQRPLSRGSQKFDTDKTLWPLNKPVPKIEALTQCSGEVTYVCDISLPPRSVHVAFVLSDVCVADIDRFDAAEALKMSGVIAFFTAKDIPGRNTFTPAKVPWQDSEEEILASNHVSYYGQPIGIVAAVTHKLAIAAAELVKVHYKNVAKPVLSIKDALAAPDKDRRVRSDATMKPTSKGEDIKHVIKGTFKIPSQYHYTMETQSCHVSPTGQVLKVRAATQWMDIVHVAVADMLDIQQNKVEVIVPRLGGAYGGKATRSALVACACALAAYKLNRTASLVMPMTHNMAAIGKRQECYVEYEVGVNDNGVIQYLDLSYYSDCGYSFNDSSAGEIGNVMANLYDKTRWAVNGYSVLTDKASNTWCRAPGTTEAFAIMEHLMERISYVTKKDPVDVRIGNLATEHSSIKEMIDTLKYESQYDARKADIVKFNADNAWRKRGLKLSIMSFPIGYSWNYPVTVSIYHGDGTVAVSHGGIEMGQGINTKVAQVCAYTLKVPLEKVAVFESDSLVSPNSMASNGSITSDCVTHATLKACSELLDRLQPVRNEMTEPTWEEVVRKAYEKGINLQSNHMTSPLDELQGYNIYGVCAAEVELDVLTGTHVLSRVDLLEDTGVSLSPDVDVGQIEGAFIMGLGLWTSEELVYHSSGKLLTDRTWTYHPPGAKDIPVDFRVMFRANSQNTAGVLRSKATGEPALNLAVAVTHALHDAVLEARKEFGYKDTDRIHIDTPYNVENILKAISPKIESYKLN